MPVMYSILQLIVKGDMGRLPGYIAIGGLSWADGYCEGQPHLADNRGNGRLSQLVQVRF